MVDSQKLREQILASVDSSNLSDEQKVDIRERIKASSDEELVNFLGKSQEKNQKEGNCIFCSIVAGDIESYKISENDSALAVLEIAPASPGHALVIPKAHGLVKDLPEGVNSLIKDVSSLIHDKLSPDKVEASRQDLMGHTIANVLPLYHGIKVEKKRASPEELNKIHKTLTSETIKLDQKKEIIILDEKVLDEKKAKSNSHASDKISDKKLTVNKKESSKKPVKRPRERTPFRIP
ncbi:HIT domain-containing protein [Candidatus Pacearchaeota archaeon]|nr:HIT domain-containing protein [Candidatus Pacearchaeota archaeon]